MTDAAGADPGSADSTEAERAGSAAPVATTGAAGSARVFSAAVWASAARFLRNTRYPSTLTTISPAASTSSQRPKPEEWGVALATASGAGDNTRGAGSELRAGGAEESAAGGASESMDDAAIGGVEGAALGAGGAVLGGGGAAIGAGGGGGADGAATGAGGLEEARSGGSENAALGIGGGAESRFPPGRGVESRSRLTGGLGAGKPIKVAERGRMGRTLLSCSAFASGGAWEAVGEVSGSGSGASKGAAEAIGEVSGSAEACGDERAGGGVSGSDSATGAVSATRIGCNMTRVTSLESSPQSVSISSVDGGVDGSVPGASLVGRGGTVDDSP